MLMDPNAQIRGEVREHTIVKRASVRSTTFELDSDNVTHCLMDQLYWNTDRSHLVTTSYTEDWFERQDVGWRCRRKWRCEPLKLGDF